MSHSASRLLPVALIGFVVSVAGCRVSVVEKPSTPAPLPTGQKAVRLLVAHGPGGATLAFVPVYINGQGPFRFTLDTGASTSTIDAELAHRLQLPVAGKPEEVSGVATVTKGTPVHVDNWRVGDVPLPVQPLVMLPFPDMDGEAQMQGLLGSDVLSRYGAVLVNYQDQILVLHPKQLAAAKQ